MDRGIITQEEFDAKKSELLGITSNQKAVLNEKIESQSFSIPVVSAPMAKDFVPTEEKLPTYTQGGQAGKMDSCSVALLTIAGIIVFFIVFGIIVGIFYKSDYQSGSSNLESSSAAVSSSLAVESEVSEEPSTEELKQEANEFDEMM